MEGAPIWLIVVPIAITFSLPFIAIFVSERAARCWKGCKGYLLQSKSPEPDSTGTFADTSVDISEDSSVDPVFDALVDVVSVEAVLKDTRLQP